MSKSLSVVFSLAALLFLAGPQRGTFSRYKSVEAYEVRTGILMIPQYTEDGQVCEIALEKHHFDDDKADLNTTIPREIFIHLIDELAPKSERGRQTMNLGREYMSSYSGHSVTTFAEYENVSIDIVGKTSHECGKGDIVAVIKWKRRLCALRSALRNDQK